MKHSWAGFMRLCVGRAALLRLRTGHHGKSHPCRHPAVQRAAGRGPQRRQTWRPHPFRTDNRHLHQDDGLSGTGYTYTEDAAATAMTMLVHDLAPFVTGRDAADVEAIYDSMQWHVHYVARGGIASFAISAIDIALWDLRCKAAGAALEDGRQRIRQVPCLCRRDRSQFPTTEAGKADRRVS